MEKTIPAIAAAFGVFRFARVRALFGIYVAIVPKTNPTRL